MAIVINSAAPQAASSSVIKHLLPESTVHCRSSGIFGEGRAILKIATLFDAINSSKTTEPESQFFIPVLWNGVFAWRKVLAVTESKVRNCEVKSVKVYDKKMDVAAASKLLSANHLYGVTSDREDGSCWVPVSSVKDGSSLRTTSLTTANRIFDLCTTTASKVRLRTLDGITVNYSLTVEAGQASMVLSSGLVIS